MTKRVIINNMKSSDKDITLTQFRMDQMDKKLDKMDEKLDELTKQLLDPDNGVAARVNKNTASRRAVVRAMWVLYGIVVSALIKTFFDNI